MSQRVCLKRPTGRASPQVPAQLEVRLVTVCLSTGELEVLLTTLLDEQSYPTQELAQL